MKIKVNYFCKNGENPVYKKYLETINQTTFGDAVLKNHFKMELKENFKDRIGSAFSMELTLTKNLTAINLIEVLAEVEKSFKNKFDTKLFYKIEIYEI
jgi:hypothetical protein